MRTRAPLLLLLPFLTGCSFVLTHRPSLVWDTPEVLQAAAVDPFVCDASKTWGVVDLTMALVSFSSGYLEAEGPLDRGQVRGRYIWVGAGVGLIWATSAVVGFKRAEGCRDLRETLARMTAPDGFTEDSPQPAPTSTRRDANLITADELLEVADRSLHEAIQALRPQWLRRTGFRDDFPSVIMDNGPYELDILETMRPNQVDTVRYISPSDATIRWGTGYSSGVIEVRTRRR